MKYLLSLLLLLACNAALPAEYTLWITNTESVSLGDVYIWAPENTYSLESFGDGPWVHSITVEANEDSSFELHFFGGFGPFSVAETWGTNHTLAYYVWDNYPYGPYVVEPPPAMTDEEIQELTWFAYGFGWGFWVIGSGWLVQIVRQAGRIAPEA